MTRCLRIAAAAVALLLPLWAAPPLATAREIVAFDGGSAGSIVVRTQERRLYYILGNGQAIRYPVGVGRAGMQWSGDSFIDGKYVKPAWAPPPDIKRENPKMASYFPGGAPNNPMGVAALTLDGGQYAIHGTNRPSSIGHFVSHGCIRMYNRDVLDLFKRVKVGTPVLVTK